MYYDIAYQQVRQSIKKNAHCTVLKEKYECISWISYAAEIKVLGQVTHVLQCLELDGRRLMAWQQSLQAFSGFVLWLT